MHLSSPRRDFGSKGSILQYFRPSLSYHLSLRSLFRLFLSGHLHRFNCIYTAKDKLDIGSVDIQQATTFSDVIVHTRLYGGIVAVLSLKGEVSLIRKYHNHRSQINLWHLEEETQNTDSHNTIKLKQPARSSAVR